MKNISIVGGGFAGLWAAMSAAAERRRQGLDGEDITIDLISNDPDLVIRPRLYEGANDEMRAPLQPLLDVIDVRFNLAHVKSVNPLKHQIVMDGPQSNRVVTYDRLILASGSRMRALSFPGAQHYGFSVDTFHDAARFDQHLADLCERRRARSQTIVVAVVGAGFTGIELVTQLRQRLGPHAKLILIEHSSAVGQDMGDHLGSILVSALTVCDIDVRLDATITSMNGQTITLDGGVTIQTDAVVFATGLEASPLTAAFKTQRDGAGRLVVDPFLKLPDDEAVFVAGDVAQAMADDSHSTFMSCQHATELGRYAGHNAVRSLIGQPLRPYRQETYATCLDLGPAGAVFTTGWDREVQKTGADGKAVKKQITQEWIYPPKPDAGAASIFEFIALDPED